MLADPRMHARRDPRMYARWERLVVLKYLPTCPPTRTLVFAVHRSAQTLQQSKKNPGAGTPVASQRARWLLKTSNIICSITSRHAQRHGTLNDAKRHRIRARNAYADIREGSGAAQLSSTELPASLRWIVATEETSTLVDDQNAIFAATTAWMFTAAHRMLRMASRSPA